MAKVEEEQKEIAEAIAKVKKKQKWIMKQLLGVRHENRFIRDSFKIRLEDDSDTKFIIKNEPTLQRYSFSDRILFEPDKYDLNEEGKKTLLVVGQIKKNLNRTSGDTDSRTCRPRPSGFDAYFFNLHLAASRAIEVYKFLQKKH